MNCQSLKNLKIVELTDGIKLMFNHLYFRNEEDWEITKNTY